MTSAEADFRRRIQQFSIDGPVIPALPFAARLARDHGWTRDYAERAIIEYKRFLILAATGEKPVCPSEQVDEVWHLHLTYSRSYWNDLCRDLLGRPLHHDPTRGGPVQDEHHKSMYVDTLTRYRDVFGSEPPADIWPGVAERFAAGPSHQHVDTAENWVIPKRPVKRGLRVVTTIALLVMVGGCVAPIIADAQAEREAWLWRFPLLFGCAFIVGLIAKRLFARPFDAIEVVPGELDRQDIALLAGGPIRVFDSSLIQLIEDKAVQYDGEERFLIQGQLRTNADPLEAWIYRQVSTAGVLGVKLAELRKDFAAETGDRRKKLEEMGLLVTKNSTGFGCLLPMLFVLPVLCGIGGVRAIQGIEAHKPWGYIGGMTVLFFLISLFTFGRSRLRTGRGEAYLNEIKSRYHDQEAGHADGASNLAMATAILGTTFLLSTEHRALAQSLHTRGDPTTSSSGCSSSDGGGGGDGGGGCGGGCGGGGD